MLEIVLLTLVPVAAFIALACLFRARIQRARMRRALLLRLYAPNRKA